MLVAGSGGREHALVWKLAQDPGVSALHAIPGNPGIAHFARCHPAAALSTDTLLRFANEFDIDLTVIGPEAPLVAGVADVFRASGRRIIGPTQEQARLEGSKIYAKKFFARHRIPSARFEAVSSPSEAEFVLQKSSYPLVIKTDGLAAGKGVVIVNSRAEAEQAIQRLGFPLVIEEFLSGEEISFIVLSDGKEATMLEPCQDHKRIFDGDQGPNTGGMGAYCDTRILTPEQRGQVMDRIIQPTIRATGFTGFLYAGLMWTADGPKLLEYNVRLGDPETQPILHRLVSPLAELLFASTAASVNDARLQWRPEPSVCVVMAASGYPEAPRTGDPISGMEGAASAGAQVFQAGTRVSASGLITAGGRVLGVCARGMNLPRAIAAAYEGVAKISFAGAQFRRDIGQKGLGRWPDASLQ